MEHSNGLSNGYARNERRLIADQRNSNFSPPSVCQQKQFFKKFENQISRRHSYKFVDTIDPYSPDVAPINIFKKNLVVPTGMHNLLKNI